MIQNWAESITSSRITSPDDMLSFTKRSDGSELQLLYPWGFSQQNEDPYIRVGYCFSAKKLRCYQHMNLQPPKKGWRSSISTALSYVPLSLTPHIVAEVQWTRSGVPCYDIFSSIDRNLAMRNRYKYSPGPISPSSTFI